jgi:hypothetical protein
LAKPDRNEKNENHRMVNCNRRARPNRSQSRPPIQPPSAAATKLAVLMNCASSSVMPNAVISAGIMKP